MNGSYLILLLCLAALPVRAQLLTTKTIDGGGTGPYPAVAGTEATLTDYPGWTIKAKSFDGVAPGSYSSFTPPGLDFVCELRVTIDPPVELGETPRGRRVIIPISGGTFSGPRMRGRVVPGGADRQYVQLGGRRTELEAIYTIETDDGVLINVRNAGLLYTPESPDGDVYFRAAPTFEAPLDSDYAWLNHALFVCKPEPREDHISIQVWRVD